MAVIEVEDRATVAGDHPQPRVVLAQSPKPQRDRAVVRALLRGLGIAFTDSDVIAPVEPPIDVRFRQAQFHLRELNNHPRESAGQAQDLRLHEACTRADGEDFRNSALGIARTGGIAHITAALAQHAAWYGARCVGLDIVVVLNEHQGVLAPPANAPELGALAIQGWRSVSVVCPPYGMVLYTTSGAPDFLRTMTGRPVRQWDTIDTLFARRKN